MFSFLIHSVQAATLPNFTQTTTLPAFISSVYSFALTVVGLAILFRILYAGFLLLTAAGNAGKLGDAQDKLKKAIIGAIILFAAYLILYIINPDLVANTFNFTIPTVTTTNATNPVQQSSPTSAAAVVAGTVVDNTVTGGFNFGLPIVHAQTGIYFFTIRVTDTNGDSFDQDYTMEVIPNLLGLNNAKNKEVLAGKFHTNQSIARAASTTTTSLAITTPTVPDAVIGVSYFAQIQAAGGTPPYIYSLVDNGSANAGLPPGLALQGLLETPILNLQNTTATRNPSYLFYNTDGFKLTLSNAGANSIVNYKWFKNGAPWYYPGLTPDTNGWINFGTTDGSGNWTNQANFSANETGTWQEEAMVNSKISNSVSFEVVDPNASNYTSTTTPYGNCPAGTVWTGRLDTSQNPPVPVCTVNGQTPAGATGATFSCDPNPPTGTCPAGTKWTCFMSYAYIPPEPLCSADGTLNNTVPATGVSAIPPAGGTSGSVCDGFGTGANQINFLPQWQACISAISNISNPNGSINYTNLPTCGDTSLKPGDPCQVAGVSSTGQATETVRCTYSNQVQAIQCGAPASGAFCIPGYGAAQGNTDCIPVPTPIP
jgi:hypothetical protein